KHRDLLPEEDVNLRRWPRLASEYIAGPTAQQDAAKQLIHFAELPVWVLRPSPVGSASILARLNAYQSPERNTVAAAVALEPEPVVELVDVATEFVAPVEIPAETVQELSPREEIAAEPVQQLSPGEQLGAALDALVAAAGELAAASADRRDEALIAFGTE